MTDVVLVYPFFRRKWDRSPFRFPPLGLGYIASFLRQRNLTVGILDCTFRSRSEIIGKIAKLKPRIVGIYSMFSMEQQSIALAEKLRDTTDLLVAGGPLPTVDPSRFLNYFDVVVVGEGEVTMSEIAASFFDNRDLQKVAGLVLMDKGEVCHTGERAYIENLDSIPFPARDLLDNDSYKKYYAKHFGQTMTSMISSRGCPFHCDFCSKPIFGDSFRSRSPENIVDEMESISKFGYDAIWFADDCFTISKNRVTRICNEIVRRDIRIKWQCLSRVDTLDSEMTSRMKRAGCQRVYFGLESGDDQILRTIMRKETNTQMTRRAVNAAKSAGIETGGFFIVGYPGESEDTILNTVRFATSLPLDYASFSLPYPIPGTGLYEKTRGTMKEPRSSRLRLIDHTLSFQSDFSECKLKLAIIKAAIQFRIRRHLGVKGYELLGIPFDHVSNAIFKAMK